MKWKLPPKIKIYESLGSIGDKRISVSENSADVYSSNRRKKHLKVNSFHNGPTCLHHNLACLPKHRQANTGFMSLNAPMIVSILGKLIT